MSLLIGLIAFLALLAAMALLTAGQIFVSQNANRTLGNRLSQIGAGIALIGLFGMAVVAARERLLGTTWWPAAVVTLSGGTIVATLIWRKRRTRR
jgi:hypothetical protein